MGKVTCYVNSLHSGITKNISAQGKGSEKSLEKVGYKEDGMERSMLDGILAMAAMQADNDDLSDRKVDEAIEKLALNDWKMLTEYMSVGFTREEAIKLIAAIHQ